MPEASQVRRDFTRHAVRDERLETVRACLRVALGALARLGCLDKAAAALEEIARLEPCYLSPRFLALEPEEDTP